MPFIELEALCYQREDWQLKAAFNLERGECLAVIGPSGAGKSTLLSLIAGFERLISGSIRINGRDYTTAEPADRPVTSLFQEHNLFAHLSVKKNVGLGRHPGLRLNQKDHLAIDQALEAVGLSGYHHRLPESLSGGERQRVALARCLCREHPLMLLDEPFAALDPALRSEMRGLIHQLIKSHDLTVIMVSHHPDEAAEIASSGIFLHQGELKAKGVMSDLLNNPQLPLLRAYLGVS
ncbi:MAG TPA: thiamine ABC transporter ATP-binding protein [Arenicellales bacterium]|nr:thiamine ABC transporter ATP-binding protein [Arenicellales bacterium]